MGKCTLLIVLSFMSGFAWRLSLSIAAVADPKLARYGDAMDQRSKGIDVDVPFEMGPIGITLVSLAGVLFIVAVVAYAVGIYQMWKSVETRNSLSPAAAIALGCVPVVSLVGIYFVVAGFPRQLNWVSEDLGAPVRASTGLALTACIFSTLGTLCACVPGVGVLAYLVAIVMMFVAQLMNAIACDRLMRFRTNPYPPVA